MLILFSLLIAVSLFISIAAIVWMTRLPGPPIDSMSESERAQCRRTDERLRELGY